MKNIKTYIFSKFLALKRRLKILIYGKFDPYPDIPKGYSFSPSEFIQHQSKDIFAKQVLEITKKKVFLLFLMAWVKVLLKDLLNV